MSTTKHLIPTLPRTAWIVCVDALDKGEDLPRAVVRRAFLDMKQAQQYCERRAADSDYKWYATAQEWRTSWRRDGTMRVQYHLYISSCPLEHPVDQQEVKS